MAATMCCPAVNYCQLVTRDVGNLSSKFERCNGFLLSS